MRMQQIPSASAELSLLMVSTIIMASIVCVSYPQVTSTVAIGSRQTILTEGWLGTCLWCTVAIPWLLSSTY